MEIKDEKTNKKIVGGAIIAMVLLSLVTGLIMAKNFQKDTSKLRQELTREYKKHKDIEYSYDEAKGKLVYDKTCSRCHGVDGVGAMIAPAFVDNTALNDTSRTLKVLIKGLKGKLERNSKTYNSIMPGYSSFPHADLAHVINYINKNFVKSEQSVTTLDVIKAKVDLIERKKAFEVKELE